jgi:hypothetical protein
MTRIVNDRSGGMWKEAVTDYFKVLVMQIPRRGLMEKREKPQ